MSHGRNAWRRKWGDGTDRQGPLKPALAVRERVAGHRLGALERGGGTPPPFQCIPGSQPVLHALCPSATPPPLDHQEKGVPQSLNATQLAAKRHCLTTRHRRRTAPVPSPPHIARGGRPTVLRHASPSVRRPATGGGPLSPQAPLHRPSIPRTPSHTHTQGPAAEDLHGGLQDMSP